MAINNNEIFNLTNKETHVLNASKCYSTCYCHRHSTSLLTGMSNGTPSSFLKAFLIINDTDDYVVHFIFLYLLKLLFIIWTNNNNNNNFFNTFKSNRSTNNTYRPTSATQDSYTSKVGLCCHAGQPMVLDRRWAAADSGLGQPT